MRWPATYRYTVPAQTNPVFHLPPEVFGPSNADFFDFKKQSHSYSEMTLFSQATYNLGAGDQAERAGGAKVDADFYGCRGSSGKAFISLVYAANIMAN
jgi:hypothetical protein